MNYAKIVNNNQTSVFDPLPGRENDMIQNANCAYVFRVSKWHNALRWLILGGASGTYYASQHKITIDNAKVLQDCIDEDGVRLVNLITKISLSGRAANQDASIFALALCVTSKDDKTKKAALDALPKVCRMSTDLYKFVDNVMTLNGHRWNRSLRRAIANWYNNKSADQVAYQVVKYVSRIVHEGCLSSRWSHKDLIILSHPKPASETHNNIYKYILNKISPNETGIGIIDAIYEIRQLSADEMTSSDKDRIIRLIDQYNIPHEVIPNNLKGQKWLWEALVPKMPLGALMRNLPKITSVGVFDNSILTDIVVNRLTSVDELCRARIHPIGIFKAMLGYQNGSNKNLQWAPNRKIVDALDEAFYLSFKNVDTVDDDIIIGLDMSGSMCSQTVLGIDYITAAQAAGAMVLSTLASAPNARVLVFSDRAAEIDISNRQRLSDAMNIVHRFAGGSTNIAAPLQYAIDKKLTAKAFIIITDNETNVYADHPIELLKKYRKMMNIPDAKLVVIALTGTRGSVADPQDINTLDVVGLDTATPKIVNAFIRGELSREDIEIDGTNIVDDDSDGNSNY